MSTPRRSPCADPTHRRKDGTATCLTCKAARERARTIAARAARGEVLLVPSGMTVKGAAIAQSWATRRETYGARGMSPEADVRQRRDAARAGRQRRQTHCRRGHRLTADNVLQGGKGRMCRTCNTERARRWRGQRPEWATVGGARVNVAVHDAWCVEEGGRLWAAVCAAHPDAGGTARRFIEARRRWDRFLASQTAWYAAAGVPLPDMKRGTAAKEAA